MSMTVEMILRLIDQASAPLRGVAAELGRVKCESEKLNAAQAGGVKAADALAHQQAWRDAQAAHRDYNANIIAGTAVIAGATATAAIAAAGYGLKQAVLFEKAMADVKKKVDLPEGESWESVERMINRTSREIGIGREKTAALAEAAAAAGVEYRDLAGFMDIAAKAASAWKMTPEQAADNLAKIKALTRWSNQELQDFSDKVAKADMTSAARASDIIEMFGRSASAAKAAGVDYDTTLGILTAVRSAGMDESVTARWFNAFTSTLRTAGEGGRGAKAAAEGFKELGLSIEQVQQGMRAAPTQTILDVLDRLQKSPDQAAIGVRLFGRQWWDEAARAGQALPEIVKQLEMISSGTWKGALDKSIATDLATTTKHLERFKSLVSEIGDNMMRWALPPINSQIERLLKTYDTAQKTGFLPGPDGQPIDRLKDKEPVPFSERNRQRFLRHIPQGESVEDYERRINVNRPSLPTFAAGAGANVSPDIDLSKIHAAVGEAQKAGEDIKASLGVTARPEVDSSAIDGLLGKLREARAQLSALGAQANAVATQVSRGVAAGSHALHDGPEAR
jgi:TP901 family phage tail tape measure protein